MGCCFRRVFNSAEFCSLFQPLTCLVCTHGTRTLVNAKRFVGDTNSLETHTGPIMKQLIADMKFTAVRQAEFGTMLMQQQAMAMEFHKEVREWDNLNICRNVKPFC